ncbi:hypothetical protein BDW74DRAFT_83966 [Aspergillus multicolor]|uniref:uncharacterized protein n=1 Tax=Aspergillus multicolor TaxID=41759 RepID=UPI003CCCD73E
MPMSPAGIKVLISIAVAMALVTIVLALRFWALFLFKKRPWYPEYLATLAYVSLVAHSALQIWSITNGMGKHTSEMTVDEIEVLRKFVTASSMTWLVNTSVGKLSMLTLYLTLFGICRTLRVAIYTTCACVAAYTVAYLVLLVLNCPPLAPPNGWFPVARGSCRPMSITEQAILIAVNMLLDCAIAALPVPVLWRLKVPRAKKISIAGVFAMGLSVVGVLIWRLGMSFHLPAHGDMSVSVVYITLPATLEMWLGMMVICLPGIAPLARRYIVTISCLRPFRPLAGKQRAGRRERPGRAADHTTGGTPQLGVEGCEAPGAESKGKDEEQGLSSSTVELVGRREYQDSDEIDGCTAAVDITERDCTGTRALSGPVRHGSASLELGLGDGTPGGFDGGENEAAVMKMYDGREPRAGGRGPAAGRDERAR